MNRPRELSLILCDAERAGLYHLPPDGVDAIAEATRGLDFELVRVDLSGCADKAGFLARIAAALRFPEWFGHNWDALADCLSDLEWLPAAGYVIVLEHGDRFRAAAEPDFVSALGILGEAAREWAGAGVPMWVFVGLHSDGVAWLPTL